MTAEGNDRRALRAPVTVYRSLHRQGLRWVELVRTVEARQARQVERVIEVARDRRFGGGR